MSRFSATLILLALLIVFLAIGAAYAISTPQWQAPDEPAHYNYIKYIVEHGTLPVLEAGDYDQAYSENFTRTPRDVQIRSIDPLRYENYSPPLYYLVAAPIYAISEGWLVAIRLLSVVLGGALVIVAYLIGAEVFPDRLHIALGGAAFVAFVPQHVAMLSAVNSDALAELLIALCVYQALRLFRSPQPSQRAQLMLGITLGLGLLAKATVYYTALPVVVAALIWHARLHATRNSAKPPGGTHYVLVFLPALTLGALFWIRNLGVYGGFDILGLARHNAIVVGQPTTAEWIAQYGLADTLWRGLTTTFRSFWGQFGWMAVPMPDGTYLVLGGLSAIALSGWTWWLIARCKMQDARCIEPRGVLLGLLVALTFGGLIYYNLTFVQHQGRYLFPALIPLGLVFTLGVDQWLSKIKAVVIRLTSKSTRDLTPWLDEAQLLALALVFVFLARLCVVALQRYIIPFLSA
ncbi:MAG: glycosyltransferase family 39 protein [Chloroflexi bacterium]|nr:glycosyltransferase family 39 protein [Chloroflexota bacterium]